MAVLYTANDEQGCRRPDCFSKVKFKAKKEESSEEMIAISSMRAVWIFTGNFVYIYCMSVFEKDF